MSHVALSVEGLYKQAQTWPCCFHPSGCAHWPSSIPPTWNL